MAKFICKVSLEIDIDDYYLEEGYELADMIENEVGNALNGSGVEWEDISSIKRIG